MEFIFENSGKKRQATKVTCSSCQLTFLKRSSLVSKVNYCSSECFRTSRRSKEKVSCSFCEEVFTLKKSRLKASKSGLYFCSRTCKDKGQRISSNCPGIQPGHYSNNKSNYREVVFRDNEKKCETCGYDKHPAAIIVHHKDRNRENNSVENLQVLCSNCHMIEHYEVGDGLFNRRNSGS